MNTMTLKVLTPVDSEILENVTSVVLQAYDGEYCIQYNHLPIAIFTKEGVITATVNGEKIPISTKGKGFAFIRNNKICVFVDEIVR